MFNCTDYGLEHTGQVGDAVLGSFLTKIESNNYAGLGAYSTVLLDKISNYEYKENYENSEIFKFHNRAFTGALQGNMITQEYTEVASPFLDVEFMNYCLHIPAKYRIGEQIYMKWIIKKYPEAAKYKWERINARITDRWVDIKGHHVLLKHLPKMVINKYLPFTRKNGYARGNSSMNPLDYWYNTNPLLKSDMDKYYESTITKITSNYSSIKLDLEKLYKGCVIDKLCLVYSKNIFHR